MKKPLENRRLPPLSTLCCLVLLATVATLLCIRAPYGFDWTDEPYYSALPYRFILGDRPFVDAWEVHQLSGLLALPFFRLYLLFTGGSTAGVILYFRYVLVLFQFLSALYAFFVLRRRSGNLPGLLFAVLLLTYAHYGLNGFSYNMMAPLFVVLSALFLFDGLEGRRLAGKLVLSGLFYALSVMAQPYFVISLPVWIVFWLMLCLSKNESVAGAREKASAATGGKGALRPLGYFVLGGALTACLLAVYLLSKASPGELFAGIRGMLGDPDHEQTNGLKTLGSYVNALRVLFGPCSYGAALLCLLGAATYFVKGEKRRHAMRRGVLWGCVLLAAITALWVLLYDYPDYHKINLCAGNLALLGPGLYFAAGKKPDRSMVLYFLGAFLSLAVQLGSNTGIRASSGALLPASLAAMLYLFDGGWTLFDARRARRFRAIAAAACACSVALMAGLRLTAVYRDEPIFSLDTKIVSGPGAGVITTASRAAQYGQLYTDITNNAPDTGRMLITNLMPAGYLMTKLPPATPSVFNMTLDAAWLTVYQRALPDNRPGYVFAVSETVGESNDIALEGTEQLTPANGWEMRRMPTGNAYILRED